MVTVPSVYHSQLFLTEHQLGAGLVVELRDDVEALRLGRLVAGAKLAFLVSIFNELKFQPVNFSHAGSILLGRESKFGPLYFLPCWLHSSWTRAQICALVLLPMLAPCF